MKSHSFLPVGFVFWIAGAMVFAFATASNVEAAQSKMSKARERLAEDFDIEKDELDSGFPRAEVMRKLCYDRSVPKFRRASIVNAGYNPKYPGSMDFNRFDNVVGLSSINVYLNKSKTAQLECFRELVTISITMATPSFGELVMSIDENTRVESMYLDDEFEKVRREEPHRYSGSGYYANLLRREFALLPKSITKIPSSPLTLKARVEIVPVNNVDAHVARTDFMDRVGAVEPAYFGFSKSGQAGSVHVSQSILSQYTERFVGGKPCPIVPLSETETELKAGVTLHEIAQRFYDTAVANTGCEQTLK
jgi:hypothetical protein